jgi:large subunit ribosomal protein L21
MSAEGYAIIAASGTQFRVAAGETHRVDLIASEPGAEVTFPNVLLLSHGGEVKVGRPYVAGVKVTGTVVRHARGKKIRIYRYKRKKGYQRTVGHRSEYTFVKITNIVQG